MLDIKESLIELISTSDFEPIRGVVTTIGARFTPSFVEKIADRLIANGVTVQKWIPIAEFPMDKEGWYLTCDHKGNRHTMYHHPMFEVPFCVYDNHRAYFPPKWFLPLPEPPKGE